MSDDGSYDGETSNIIGRWASSLGLDAVVWTNLPPKFNGEEVRIPTVEEVISFLNVQSSDTRTGRGIYSKNDTTDRQ